MKRLCVGRHAFPPILIAAVLVLAEGCSSSTGPTGKVRTIQITPDSLTIEMRDTVRLSAMLEDSSGHPVQGISPQWSFSNPTVASVSTSGVLIGKTVGGGWVRATAMGVADSAAVSVLVPVTSMAVFPASVNLVKGSTVLISPYPRDSANNYLFPPIRWTSSDTNRATVVGNVGCFVGYCGQVTAKDSGTVTITATAGHKQASAQLVVSILRFSALVTAQDHTCGLTPAGAVWCWGLNSIGELAVPYYDMPRTTPGLIRGGFRFTTLTSGGDFSGGFTCALTTSGSAYCWGQNNGQGQLGSAAQSPDTLPTIVLDGPQFSAISGGNSHGCGLSTAGAAYCWGDNGAGEVGTDTLQNPEAYNAVPVVGGFTFTALAAGGGHTCALGSGGAAYCWGANDHGQLGNDSTPSGTVHGPRAVTGGLAFKQIVVGAWHSCGLTMAGSAYCWGWNESGQLGHGDTLESHAPELVTGGLTFATIAAGTSNTCGVTTTGSAYCWGANDQGQLGVGGSSTAMSTSPAPVTGGVLFSTIVTRSGQSCGISTGGLAYCWGLNVYGQLGDGTANSSSSPVLVVGQQ